MSGDRHKRFEELRTRAEEFLARKPEGLQAGQAAELRELVYDLNVHLIELDAENERLARSLGELEESQRQISSLFDFAPFGYFTLNEHAVVVGANFIAGDMLGISRPKMINAPFTRFIDPAHHADFGRHMQDIIDTGRPQTCEVVMRRGDGASFPAELHIVGIYERAEIVYRLSMTDITERRRHEAQLKMQGLMLESIAEAVFSTDEKLLVRTWNHAAEAEYGWHADETLGRELHEVLGIEYPGNNREEVLRQLFEEGHWRGEVIHKKRDGTRLNIIATRSVLKDEAGGVIGVVVIAHDITDLRQSQKAVAESEGRLRSTMDNMLEGCQIIDPRWRYVYVNEAAAKQGKRTRDELLGRTMMEAYPGIEQTELFASLRDCMEKRTPVHVQNEFVFPNGTKGLFDLRIEPVPEGILVLSLEVPRRARSPIPGQPPRSPNKS